MGEFSTSLRVLASPGAVLALMVLALNDQVLKQAWPGWVTGKLSDVAGLVLAPLLLAAALAALRLRRPLPSAIVMTGAGFVVVKASADGAAFVSDLWSLGFPTVMRADVTDLLALPALGVAWWLDAEVRCRPTTGWRRSVAVAVGMMVLPVGVLATAATSCDGDEGIWSVDAVHGRFSGTDSRQAFVVRDDVSGWMRMDPLNGHVNELADGDVSRLQDSGQPGICDRTGLLCWRIEEFERVQSSVDGGVTWRDDLVVSPEDQAKSVEALEDPGCGDEASARLTFVAVMDMDGVQTVAVTAKHLGIWLRDPDGDWSLVTREVIATAPEPDDPGGRPPRGRLRVVAVPPRSDGTADDPTRDAVPLPGCASPTEVVVTPNPRNGPPTTYEACP